MYVYCSGTKEVMNFHFNALNEKICKWLIKVIKISFFIFLSLIMVVKTWTLLITILAKIPWREDKEGSLSFRWGRKTQESYSNENPRSQVGTENPIHIVPSVLEVKGDERYATPTTPPKIIQLSFCSDPQNVLTVLLSISPNSS